MYVVLQTTDPPCSLHKVTNCVFDDIDVAFQPFGEVSMVEFVGNTITRANGNTVMMTGQARYRIAENVFTRDDAPRYFMCNLLLPRD